MIRVLNFFRANETVYMVMHYERGRTLPLRPAAYIFYRGGSAHKYSSITVHAFKMVNLLLGYSHPINYPIPDQIKVTVEENTKLTIEGPDRQVVGLASGIDEETDPQRLR